MAQMFSGGRGQPCENARDHHQAYKEQGNDVQPSDHAELTENYDVG